MRERWSVEEEIAKGYKVEWQRGHGKSGAACPYCGYINRKHMFRCKDMYSKCEECGKISKLHNIK